VLAAQGGLARATRHLAQSVALLEAVSDADPEDYETRLALAQARGVAAGIRERMGARDEACELLRRASEGFSELEGRHPLPPKVAPERARVETMYRACPQVPVSPSPEIRRGL
jgi:hypothetical protein